MQKENKTSNKSGILLVIFLALTVSTALVSEIFQAPRLENLNTQLYENPFKQIQFAKLREIRIENKVGQLVLKSSIDLHSKEMNKNWDLVIPRKLPANNQTIAQIIATIKAIKIKKLFQYDDINLSNFSLNDPVLKITLNDDTEDHMVIKMGLINPIDNTCYISVDGKNHIYQVKHPSESLETVAVNDLINSRVFSHGPQNISKFTIFNGPVANQRKHFSILKNKDAWRDSKKNPLDGEALEEYLKKITDIKSFIILDQKTKRVERKLKRYLTTPMYSIEITNYNGVNVQYTISQLMGAIPELKIGKRQYFVMTASDRKHPYILHKQHLQLFRKKIRSFKKIPIKKLFY